MSWEALSTAGRVALSAVARELDPAPGAEPDRDGQRNEREKGDAPERVEDHAGDEQHRARGPGGDPPVRDHGREQEQRVVEAGEDQLWLGLVRPDLCRRPRLEPERCQRLALGQLLGRDLILEAPQQVSGGVNPCLR